MLMRRARVARRLVVASFANDRDLLVAIRRAREAGIDVVDAYGPFAVHGVEEAMGLRPTRLPWACFLLGATGFALALWLQYWTSAVDWPLDVGGKPFDSLPAFVPVAFELTVLFAGLGTVAAFFLRCGLLPGSKEVLPAAGVTDDRFVLVVRERRDALDVARLSEILAPASPVAVEDGVEETES